MTSTRGIKGRRPLIQSSCSRQDLLRPPILDRGAAGIDPGTALPRVERLHEDRNRKRRPVVGLVPADLADCAARKSAAHQFIHGGDTARVGTTDLVLAKANGDIEAPLELLGGLGGSHIRLLFASNGTLADSEHGCNRIAKLLKRLIIMRRIVNQASILA